MSGQTVPAQKRRRGPKPTGKGVQIGVRLQPDDLAALDAYRTADEIVTRPQAIRTALSDWLRTHGYKKLSELKATGPATDAVEAMESAIKKHHAKTTRRT